MERWVLEITSEAIHLASGDAIRSPLSGATIGQLAACLGSEKIVVDGQHHSLRRLWLDMFTAALNDALGHYDIYVVVPTSWTAQQLNAMKSILAGLDRPHSLHSRAVTVAQTMTIPPTQACVVIEIEDGSINGSVVILKDADWKLQRHTSWGLIDNPRDTVAMNLIARNLGSIIPEGADVVFIPEELSANIGGRAAVVAVTRKSLMAKLTSPPPSDDDEESEWAGYVGDDLRFSDFDQPRSDSKKLFIIGGAVILTLIAAAIVIWPRSISSDDIAHSRDAGSAWSDVAATEKLLTSDRHLAPEISPQPADVAPQTGQSSTIQSKIERQVKTLGRVQYTIPATFTARQGAERAVINSPSGGRISLVANQLEQPAQLDGVAKALIAEINRRGDSAITDFTPASTVANRQAITYKEKAKTGGTIEWVVVVEHSMQISIGCQAPNNGGTEAKLFRDECVNVTRSVKVTPA